MTCVSILLDNFIHDHHSLSPMDFNLQHRNHFLLFLSPPLLGWHLFASIYFIPMPLSLRGAHGQLARSLAERQQPCLSVTYQLNKTKMNRTRRLFVDRCDDIGVGAPISQIRDAKSRGREKNREKITHRYLYICKQPATCISVVLRLC